MHVAHHPQDAIASLTDPLLRLLDRRPVFVDVGASAEVPPVWRPLARHGVYVGFDPDLREMRQENGGQFHNSFVLNKAVTTNVDSEGVTFRLTRAPQCSSTLRPNRAVLDNYLRSDRFDVQSEAVVPATTLDAAITHLSLGRIDWLKLDTQGTDLRLFNSLSDPIRGQVLAVDAEPGLRGAYEGEDLYGDLHTAMIKQGFWCAAATVKGLPRVRPATLARLAQGYSVGKKWLPAIALEETARELPICPGWVECRYLRTAESLEEGPFDQSAYIMLWAFALAANQPGFAGDIAVQYGQRFGQDNTWQAMAAGTTNRFCTLAAENQARRALQQGLLAKVRRIARRFRVSRQVVGRCAPRAPAATPLTL